MKRIVSRSGGMTFGRLTENSVRASLHLCVTAPLCHCASVSRPFPCILPPSSLTTPPSTFLFNHASFHLPTSAFLRFASLSTPVFVVGMLRQRYPDVPIQALTATATQAVKDDIVESLGMVSPTRHISSCIRDNLFYEVQFKDAVSRLGTEPKKHLVQFIKAQRVKATTAADSDDEIGVGGGGGGVKDVTGIIYSYKRQECDALAGYLASKGIIARAYHAGLKKDERLKLLEDWAAGRVPVVVATIAFGMGIDKADVRFVVHWTIPKSMEGYYQESGRAGWAP